MGYTYYAVLVKRISNDWVISHTDRKNHFCSYDDAEIHAEFKNSLKARMAHTNGKWFVYYERSY